MRRIAVLVALTLMAAGKPAAAACRGAPCPPWVNAIGWTFAAGAIGGYAYGTGYLIYHDVTDPDQSLEYGVAEFATNGLGTALFGGVMIDALAHGKPGTAVSVAPFAMLHTTLMVHGGWRIYRERDDFRAPQNAMLWLGGAAFTTNALIWSSQLGERHGRSFGLAEAAVNGPLAVGLGYVAYSRLESWHASGFLYGGMAAVSAGFAIHGVRTLISPAPPQIDIGGLDLSPTVVSDGIEMAPGLGTAGTW